MNSKDAEMSDENVQSDYPCWRPKLKRRSSILKTTKPLDELQNISSKDERFQRERRVSFANTIKIKEFLPTRADEQEHNIEVTGSTHGLPVNTSKSEEFTIQISTPMRKKCRRISSTAGLKTERFSLIPKLDQSFPLCESDEDFQIFEEDSQSYTATFGVHVPIFLQKEDVSAVTNNELKRSNLSAVCEFPKALGDVSNQSAPLDNSDMDLTGCDELAQLYSEPPSFCSPECLLKPLTTKSHSSISHKHLTINEGFSPVTYYASDEDLSRSAFTTTDITCGDDMPCVRTSKVPGVCIQRKNTKLSTEEEKGLTCSLRRDGTESSSTNDQAEQTSVCLCACNWLQDASNTFLLVNPSPLSKVHANFDCIPGQRSTNIPNTTVSESELLPVTLTNDYSLQLVMPGDDQKLVVNSPQFHCISFDNCDGHGVSSLKGVTYCHDERFPRQSLMISPSVLSKFLTKLQCDRSSLCMRDSDDHEDMCQQVDLLSLSLAHTCISATSEECMNVPYGETCTQCNTSGPFSALLDVVCQRIVRVVDAMRARINSSSYVRAHHGVHSCLQKMMSAANRCLCVIDVLSKFGRLSGLSKKGCDWSILKLIPLVEISSNDLLGDNHQKAVWIHNMHNHIQLDMYPAVESVLRAAASIYPWHIDKWSETEMQITCHRQCILTLELFEEHGTATIGIRKIHCDSFDGVSVDKEGIICSSIHDIPQMLYNIQV